MTAADTPSTELLIDGQEEVFSRAEVERGVVEHHAGEEHPRRAAPPLDGRRVLLTGGTTGIGRATALALAEGGAHVFTFGRDPGPLEDVLAEGRRAKGRIDGVVADVSRPEDVARVFEAADRALGGLDVLINNAAIAQEGLSDSPEAEWRYALETNLVGYIACCHAALPRLEAGGDPQVVFIGSMSAVTREPGSSVYVAAKAGIEGFAMSFRRELAEKGVRVSLIEPGMTGSDMQGPAEEQRPQIAAEKMLLAEDIAAGVLYVLSQPRRCNVTGLQIEPLKVESPW